MRFCEPDNDLLDREPLMAASEVPLRGLHNIENTLAAAAMAPFAGCDARDPRGGHDFPRRGTSFGICARNRGRRVV